MKKFITFMLVALLFPIGLALFGCAGGGSEADHIYNMVMCQATNPAQIAVMDATENEHSTYIWLERVSTYLKLNEGNYKHFTKANGWTKNAQSENKLTQDVINDFRDRIVNVKAKDTKAQFNIYVRDMDVLSAYQMVVEAELNDDDYKIILAEDGSGLYSAFQTRYITNKTVTETIDEPYAQLLQDVEGFDTVIAQMKKGNYTANLGGDNEYKYVFAAATKSNVQIYLYIKSDLKTKLDANASIAGSKIYQSAGFITSQDEDLVKINFVEKPLAETYQKLSDANKEVYKELSLGEKYSLFTRSEKPTLVIAGTSITSMAGLNLVEDVTNVEDIPEEAKAIAGYSEIQNDTDKLTAYNQYLEYKAVFEAIEKVYGQTYDILYKDHPKCGPEDGRESYWTSRYSIKGKWQYHLVQDFFANNEAGKKIGILPSGIGIDNFVFLGYKFNVAGWDSSFYKTFPEDSTMFLITTTPTANYTNFGSTRDYMIDGQKHDNAYTWNTYKIHQILDPDTYNYYTVDRLGNVKREVKYTIDGVEKSVFVDCGADLSSVEELKGYTWTDSQGNAITSVPSQSTMFTSALTITGKKVSK